MDQPATPTAQTELSPTTQLAHAPVVHLDALSAIKQITLYAYNATIYYFYLELVSIHVRTFMFQILSKLNVSRLTA